MVQLETCRNLPSPSIATTEEILVDTIDICVQ